MKSSKITFDTKIYKEEIQDNLIKQEKIFWGKKLYGKGINAMKVFLM